jgi:tetratricopeptide (TPR) repeat protein
MNQPLWSLPRVLWTLAPGGTLRVTAWGAVVAVLGVFLWFSPLSPTVLSRGDVALGQGRPMAAVHWYDLAARHSPWIEVRREALRRSARVWSIELAHPREARRRLETLTHLPLPGAQLAETFDEIGDLLLDEGQPAEAARVLRQAHDVQPGDAEAGDRLLRAARALSVAGQTREAERLLRQLGRDHPVLRSAAELERAHLHLRLGDTEGALAAYESAGSWSFDGDVMAVAALGTATCLERLGDLDEALAELDEADLPQTVQQARTANLLLRVP